MNFNIILRRKWHNKETCGLGEWTQTVIDPGNEGPSEDTFPSALGPDYVYSENERFQNVEQPMEFPYIVRFPAFKSTSRPVYNLVWNTLIESGLNTLKAFFDARRGPTGAFTWTPPNYGASPIKVHLLGKSFKYTEYSRGTNKLFKAQAIFERLF